MTTLIFQTKTNPNQEFTIMELFGMMDDEWKQVSPHHKLELQNLAQKFLNAGATSKEIRKHILLNYF